MPDGSFFLSRYDDCAAVYRDPQTWSSDKKIDFKPNFGDSSLYEHHTTSLVFNDPPYHDRVRKLLAPAFTPRALKALQPRVEVLVDRLLDRAAARGGMDLMADFATEVPLQLIGDMLGMPENERGALPGWSLAILGALEPVLSPEQFKRGTDAVDEFKTLSARADRAPPARAASRRQRDPVQADRRQRVQPGGRARRGAERTRAAAQLHFSAQRRARDDGQSHRQRRRSPDPQSRCDARICAPIRI